MPHFGSRWPKIGTVFLAFRKLFPAAWFEEFKFPLIEDLINQPPFSSFPSWLSDCGLDWDQPLGPHNAGRQAMLVQRHAEGQQARAHSHRAALPPLFPFGLTPDEHFQQALHRAQLPLPFEHAPVLDQDLQFAAYLHAKVRGHLRRWRQQAVGSLRELKQRWQGVTAMLRSRQEPAIQQVTKDRDLGLTALLLLLTSWADTGYPFGLIRGLLAVGYAPAYGVFPSQPAYPLTLDDVLSGWQAHNKNILSQLRPGRNDEFLLKQSIVDAEKGFCTFPMSRTALLQTIQGQAHRLIPRCAITQSSGRQRVIDNADTGGQSERSQDANKLQLCSPFRPAQQIALAMQYMTHEELQAAQASDAWQTGGEDWPDAYRHSPMSRQECLGCVVTFWHHEWQTPAFQLYGGLLFGLPLAVTSFNRYSKLVESLGRDASQAVWSPCTLMMPISWTGVRVEAHPSGHFLNSTSCLGLLLLLRRNRWWQPLVPSWAWPMIWVLLYRREWFGFGFEIGCKRRCWRCLTQLWQTRLFLQVPRQNSMALPTSSNRLFMGVLAVVALLPSNNGNMSKPTCWQQP